MSSHTLAPTVLINYDLLATRRHHFLGHNPEPLWFARLCYQTRLVFQRLLSRLLQRVCQKRFPQFNIRQETDHSNRKHTLVRTPRTLCRLPAEASL